MANCAQIRQYQKGELIYSHDQECLGLIKVLSGNIRTFMLSDEGREIVLYRLQSGDTDVLSASCVVNQITFETQMTADTDCRLLIVPAVCLSNFKENNLPVRCFIFEKLGEKFSDVMHQMQKILFTPVDVRLSGAIKDHMEKHYQQLKELSENLQICPVALYLHFSILVYVLQTLKLWTVFG